MYKHIYVHRFYKSDHGSGEWQLITTMHDDDVGWSICVFQFQGTVRLASNFYLKFPPMLAFFIRPIRLICYALLSGVPNQEGGFTSPG